MPRTASARPPKDAPHQGGAVSATLRYSREDPPVKRDHGRAGFLTPRHAPPCAAEAPQDDSSAESKLRRFGPPTGTDEKYSVAWRGTGRGARYSPRTPAARIRRTGDLHEISQRRFLKRQHVRREAQRSWRSRPQCCRYYNLCALLTTACKDCTPPTQSIRLLRPRVDG
jgi:hypothetical protein